MDSSSDEDHDLARSSATTQQKSFDFDEWSKELDSHPAFMSSLPENFDGNEYIEALQSLKYDDEEDTFEVRALAYKEDGNRNFQQKKYHQAIDCYTAGIRLDPSDKQLVSALYGNRAAAHFYLGVKCLIKLNYPDSALEWLTDLKALDGKCRQLEMSKLFAQVEEARSRVQRDSRKEAIKQRLMEQEKLALLNAIKKRGIKFYDRNGIPISKSFEWSDIEVEAIPLRAGVRVRLNSQNCLEWPVLFLYPEHNQSELVEKFEETSTFLQHLEHMFATSAPWDENHNYTLADLQLIFPSSEKDRVLYSVPHSWTLNQLLCYPW
ncbi:unnamed protein product [Soboliphyme baturini]|uniref:TPR_REGION domain-containing protein n=1 Tax=Soboliphyme baturini TaxID=241478 RepID=A0A183IHJ6_9BILA|nr:unnamed protein product [Soboliphyme baturini]